MNASELSRAIGQTAQFASKDDLLILVFVTDAKQVYGRTRYLVTPVSGSGQVWVDSSRINFEVKL